MDYSKLKAEIKEIADIAAQLPEPFRDRCFSILLEHLVEQDTALPPATPAHAPAPAPPVQPPATVPPPPSSIPINTVIRVFMQRTSVTKEELERVVLVDGGDVHFIRDPAHGTVAKGQIEWALLLSLRNAFVSNEFSTDPEDVRSICQEKGFYDRANFAAVFKRDPYVGYFRHALQPQGPREPLSNEGQVALGELVKTLARAGE